MAGCLQELELEFKFEYRAVPMTAALHAEPRTARGARSRAALVRAAREVFERDGFLDARIADIAAAAGVATGSFYSYFATKEAAFAAVIAEVQDEMLHPEVREDRSPDEGPLASIEAANRAYLRAYKRNAKLMALMDQVFTIDPEFKRLRMERARAFAERNAAGIRRLQEEGLADPSLDPLAAAYAMDAMVSRMASLVFVGGHRMGFEALVQTLTRMWANALRLPVE
jgi:AcrR family transcriptional regulator